MSKTRLLRDFDAEKIPLDSFTRLGTGSEEHHRELHRQLKLAVERMAESNYTETAAYAEVIEVLKCLAFINSIDWLDVEDSIWDQMVTHGKYLQGILQNVEDE